MPLPAIFTRPPIECESAFNLYLVRIVHTPHHYGDVYEISNAANLAAISKLVVFCPSCHSLVALARNLTVRSASARRRRIFSNQYFLPLLLLNPHHAREVETMAEVPRTRPYRLSSFVSRRNLKFFHLPRSGMRHSDELSHSLTMSPLPISPPHFLHTLPPHSLDTSQPHSLRTSLPHSFLTSPPLSLFTTHLLTLIAPHLVSLPRLTLFALA